MRCFFGCLFEVSKLGEERKKSEIYVCINILLHIFMYTSEKTGTHVSVFPVFLLH